MLSVAEALERILAPLSPLGTETVALDDAHGRVLARDVVSTLDHPSADVSAMDGFAVRAHDVAVVPCSLEVIGESRAGASFAGRVGDGQAVRIFTGATMPANVDTVIVQENTELEGKSVRVLQSAGLGTFVRPAGLDIRVGETLIQPGRRLTARDLGVVAAANHAEVTVFARPRIAILATGDELVLPGEPAGPDQIVSSNSVALAAYVRGFGGEPAVLPIARDNAKSLAASLSNMADADMLITIGGASVGDYDLVKSALGDEGLQLDFHKVAMRPGKPLISGRINGVPMLGLPGNPVSVGVTSCLFVGPALGILGGAGVERPEIQRARLGRNLGANDHRQDYLRAQLSRDDNGEMVAMPIERQDSSMLASFARADCLVMRAPEAPAIAAGEWVDIVRFPTGVERF